MKYLLVSKQSGGCDYTIACGIDVDPFTAASDQDAIHYAKRVIRDRDGFGNHEMGLDDAIIYRVSEVSFSFSQAKVKYQKQLTQQTQRQEEQQARAQLAQLKARFE